jgi:hypothetical protein
VSARAAALPLLTRRLPRDRRRLQRHPPRDRRTARGRRPGAEGFPPNDLPAQTDVFAPDYAPEEIAQIAQKLRKAAGLPDKVTGIVANDHSNGSVVKKVLDKVT